MNSTDKMSINYVLNPFNITPAVAGSQGVVSPVQPQLTNLFKRAQEQKSAGTEKSK